MKHLINERNLVVAKSSSGVHCISKEIFIVQIIVTKELPPEENLYLRCLTDQLQDTTLVNRLSEDYKEHQDQDIYMKYMNQLTNANVKKEGESPMVCEGILNLCGTSSEEIIERTTKERDAYYLPKINKLTSSNEQLISSNKQLTSSNTLMFSQINYLKNLLKQNNIPFDLDSIKQEKSLTN